MTSNLHNAILDETKRRKPMSGAGSSYGKGWNAAMDSIARILDAFEDDGSTETRVRYEWAIRNEDGTVHRVTVARTIADLELARLKQREPELKAEVVCSRVVGEMRSPWVVPTEPGVLP